jgi:hypothetical protein
MPGPRKRVLVPPMKPQGLLQAALDYAAWARDNPIVVARTVGGEAVEERHDRPLTFEGFVTHARLDPGLIDRTRVEAPAIFGAVRALFFDQQYSRAAIGSYDRHLVAAYFGLAERRQVEASVTVAHLSDADLDAELAALMEVVDIAPDARIGSDNGNQSPKAVTETLTLPRGPDRPE